MTNRLPFQEAMSQENGECVVCGGPPENLAPARLPDPVARAIGIRDGVPRKLEYPVCTPCVAPMHVDLDDSSGFDVMAYHDECAQRAFDIVLQLKRCPPWMSMSVWTWPLPNNDG